MSDMCQLGACGGVGLGSQDATLGAGSIRFPFSLFHLLPGGFLRPHRE